jgi:pimeloyl-ACP methyl ester carboxylesterase
MVHSQSGQFGWTLGDANPSTVKGIIALEPTGPPFIDAVFSSSTLANLTRPFGITVPPITYEPPVNSPSDLKPVIVSSDLAGNYTCYKQAEPARKLVNLLKIPILMVTSESSFHAVYDGCTAGYLAQAGVNVEHIRLESVGIRGNGHMMFMEKNGLQIAEEVVEKWIVKTFAT